MSLWGSETHEDLLAHIEDLERRLSLAERRLDLALKWADRALEELRELRVKKGSSGKPKARTVTLTPEFLEKVMQLDRQFRASDQRTAEVLADADVLQRKLRAGRRKHARSTR